jgi:hypothetical protein
MATLIAPKVARILVLKEGMRPIALDISTPELHKKVALAVLTYRMNNGFYPEPTPPTEPDFPQKDIKKLPSGTVRAYAQILWNKFKQAQAEHEELYQAWRRIRDVVDNKDGDGAIAILNSRRTLDGENIDIFDVQADYQG